MEDNLLKKVNEWATKEGVPLEYYTADCFKRNGFVSFQGQFVIDEGVAREIDVYARTDFQDGKNLLRISHVVECKWTKNKPWVVYTQKNMYHPSALIAQSIGNNVGQALMWLAAESEVVKSLSIFNDIDIVGFSGKQMQENGKTEQFYSAIQSIITKTVISSQDEYQRANPFDYMEISFPLIVIDGLLFASKYDNANDSLNISEAKSIRINWKGSAKWPFTSRIDIVTKDHLNDFLIERQKEFKILANELLNYFDRLKSFYESADVEVLKLRPTSRGIIGYPEFIGKQLLKKKKSTETNNK